MSVGPLLKKVRTSNIPGSKGNHEAVGRRLGAGGIPMGRDGEMQFAARTAGHPDAMILVSEADLETPAFVVP